MQKSNPIEIRCFTRIAVSTLPSCSCSVPDERGRKRLRHPGLGLDSGHNVIFSVLLQGLSR